MVNLKCKYCQKEFKVIDSRKKTAKYCSKKCSNLSKIGKSNTECTQCGKNFHLKESSKKRYKRTQGYFCSTKCVSDFRKNAYLGQHNPNYKGLNVDYNGYKLDYLPKFGRIKLHHKMVFEYLNISSLPKNYCVHHRDCNINNNDVENLVVLSHSDHRWLHKNFGNASLWAYMNSLVKLNDLCSWCRKPLKAKKLLTLNVLKQKNEFI